MQSILDPSLIHIVSYIHTGFIVNTCDDVCIYILLFTTTCGSPSRTAAISNVGGCFTILPHQKLDDPNQEWTNEGYLVQVGTSRQEQERNFTARCSKLAGIEKRNIHGVRATAVIRAEERWTSR